MSIGHRLVDGVHHVAHLVRRFAGALSRTPPATEDAQWAESQLLDHEVALWRRFGVADQRHSITVARRFETIRPSTTRAELAGALLHDIGKLDSGLGTFGRVAATIVGPRTDRFRRYADHEEIGATWLDEAGSDPVTVELVRSAGPAAADLHAADHL